MTAAATAMFETSIGFNTEVPRDIRLDLTVRDPETVLELWRRPKGEGREGFALSALRLGVMALRQASGVIDTTTIRQEGERLIAGVREMLSDRANQLLSGLSGSLKEYFDPSTGQLPQRLERLLKRDGDLESLLGRHLNGDTSTLARTLASHVGETSPLLKMLSPTQGDGVVAALTEVIGHALEEQRDHVIRQFSLDEDTSALSRLLKQIVDANGKFRAELSTDIEQLSAEFSLDNDEGALARLVRQVDRSQKSIFEQFSSDNEDSALRRMTKLLETTNKSVQASLTLDDEKSPLSRLRRELMNVLEEQKNANSGFQTEVRAVLESMQARREEVDRSTRHGGEFQDAVGSVIQAEAQRLGDIFEDVGDTGGNVSRCRIGDHVIALGADSAAPGAKIVIEAKEDKSYSVRMALAEIEKARQNRCAQLGIFVFSSATVPDGTEMLKRYGNDIVVVWDQDDPASDIRLKCAVSMARALVIRERQASAATEANFDEIDSAVERLSKDATLLTEVNTWANTVQSNGKKIADRVEKVREDIEKQIEFLQDNVARLKNSTPTA